MTAEAEEREGGVMSSSGKGLEGAELERLLREFLA